MRIVRDCRVFVLRLHVSHLICFIIIHFFLVAFVAFVLLIVFSVFLILYFVFLVSH